MHPRTPLLLLVAALPFAGCTCNMYVTPGPRYSTNQGGHQVVVVQEDPNVTVQDRNARIAREREWERETERARARRPVIINQGGRYGTGANPSGSEPGHAGPHAPAYGQPSAGGYQGGGYQGGTSGGGSSSGGDSYPGRASTGPATSMPGSGSTAGNSGSTGTTPTTPNDTYVAPREINKPTGGPAGAASPVTPSTSTDKNVTTPPKRTGRMTRQQ